MSDLARQVLTQIQDDINALREKYHAMGLEDEFIDQMLLVNMSSKALSRGETVDTYFEAARKGLFSTQS